jgi:fucose 4-O-acetylase-like acetyltransferase
MKQRLVYLDNIKVFLIAYVITGHLAASYGAIGGGKWNYLEPVHDFATKATLSLYVLVAYSFLMSMFIFIAGYFTYPSLKKKGMYNFVKDRIIRLGIPLIFYYFIIGPLVKYISNSAKGYDGSFGEFLSGIYHSGVYGYIGVMWFVVLILIFSVVYSFYLHFFPDGWYKPKNDAFPGNFQIAVFVLVVGMASYLNRLVFPQGNDLSGGRTLASMVFFGTSFFLGTTAYRYGWLEKLRFKEAKPWFISAVVVMVVPVILLIIYRKTAGLGSIARSGSVASLFYAYWEVIKSLGTGMIAVVIFRKWLNKPGKFVDALGGSVFMAYFLHPLVCVLYLYAFSSSHLHPLLKFAIVAPAALSSTFFAAWLLRRIPFIRKVL